MRIAERRGRRMIVVGKKKFLKKDKSSYCHVLTILTDFTDNQRAEGCEGMASSDVFISEKFFNEVTSEYFNRECIFDYAMNSFGHPEPVAIRFADVK